MSGFFGPTPLNKKDQEVLRVVLQELKKAWCRVGLDDEAIEDNEPSDE